MSSSMHTAAKSFIDGQTAFRICYIVSVLFTTVTYINLLSYGMIALLFFWGAHIIIHNWYASGRYKAIPYYHYFILFLGLSIPGIVLTLFKKPFAGATSLVMLIFTAFYIFIFFGMQTEKPYKATAEAVLISRIILYITGVINLTGFVLLFIFHNQIIVFGERLLILENRYMGLYFNPNQAGYVCFFATVCALLLRNQRLCRSAQSGVERKRIVIPCILMNVVTIILSASNGAMMILLVFSSFLMMFGIYRCLKEKKLLQFALRVLIVLAVISTTLAFSVLCRTVASHMVSGEAIVEIQKFEPTEEQIQQELHNESGEVTFEHINAELGSGRLQLYEEAWRLFVKNPLTGIGSGGVLFSGIRDNMGGLFDFHNGYLTILNSGGIFAFSLFMFVGFKVLITLCRSAVAESADGDFGVLQICSAFLVAYCVYAMVEPTFLYNPTIGCCSLWFILGTAYSRLRQRAEYEPYRPGAIMAVLTGSI